MRICVMLFTLPICCKSSLQSKENYCKVLDVFVSGGRKTLVLLFIGKGYQHTRFYDIICHTE
jgi:hypothetical protein